MGESHSPPALEKIHRLRGHLSHKEAVLGEAAAKGPPSLAGAALGRPLVGLALGPALLEQL